jgi:hypothetical protein
VARRGPAIQRLLGIAVLAGVVAYLFTPGSGGLNFPFNVRYLAPVMFLSFALLPLVAGSSTVARRACLAVLTVLVVVDTTSPHQERVPAWPSSELLVAALVLLAVAAISVAAWALWPRLTPRVRAVASASLIAALVAICWPVQRAYLDERYVNADLPIDNVYEFFRDVRDSQVAVYGTPEVYPLFGVDLSNGVSKRDGPSTRESDDPCTAFRDVISGKYRYVVIGRYVEAVTIPVAPPDSWFEESDAVDLVARDGETVVYRINGSFMPSECDSGQADIASRAEGG